MSLPRRTTFLAVLLLVALAGVLTYVFPFRQILAQQRAVELAETKLEVLQAENTRLAVEVEVLHDPVQVERMAREQFGLVRPGEVAYVVLSPPEEFAVRQEDREETEEEPGPRSWWGQVWDFLTGRDLVPDA